MQLVSIEGVESAVVRTQGWPPSVATHVGNVSEMQGVQWTGSVPVPAGFGTPGISSCSSAHCSASTRQQCPYRKRVGMQLGFCRIPPCGSRSCACQTGNMVCWLLLSKCAALLATSQRMCHLRRASDHQDRADKGGAPDALHLHSYGLTGGWRRHHLPLPLHHRC